MSLIRLSGPMAGQFDIVTATQIAISLIFDSDDEEEDDDGDAAGHVGSRPGRSAAKVRNVAARGERLFLDYFAEHPVYSAADFRRRFRYESVVVVCG